MGADDYFDGTDEIAAKVQSQVNNENNTGKPTTNLVAEIAAGGLQPAEIKLLTEKLKNR